LIQELVYKLYAASISIDATGAMVVTSSRERFFAWATLFCFIAATSLIAYLVMKTPVIRKLSLGLFLLSLIIPAYIIPTARSEYIKVSENEIFIDSSNWLVQSQTHVALNNLQSLRESQDGILPGNLLGDPSVLWHFAWRDGQSRTIVLNDFFNAHRFVVAHYIRDRGNRVLWLDKPVDNTFIQL
jgi:hypothetical protein